MNEFDLSENARTIFKNLYSLQNETIEETFKRVAEAFATTDEEEGLAFELLSSNTWRPNTPVFLNAGTEHKNFCACHVVGLQDSMESIYDVANVSRKIFQYGAGVGIPIGNLREKDAFIFEGNPNLPPEGKSSGPIVFMRLYDAVGDTTKSGGRVRRAAIMVSMYCWHPDIMEFIQCKQNEGWLTNMNISVAITDKFMQCLEDNVPFQLYTPFDGTEKGTIDPQELWDALAVMAHKTGDPGVLFLDAVQESNPLRKKFLIESTNPCGEQPLMPWGVCNLSAINVGKFVVGDDEYDWDSLYKTAYDVTGLMDNVIDMMDYPDPRFKDTAQKYRQIGLGMMGLADAMYKLNYRYDGPEGKKFAAEVMRTITTASVEKSADMAKEKGAFFEFEEFKEDMLEILKKQINNRKVLKKVRANGVRNSQFTTCQPTGTTALSCDCSYGIEPIFGLVFEKKLVEGDTMKIANPIFLERVKDENWWNDSMVEKIFENGGSLKGIHGIPREVREVFITAHDIKPKDRVDMQAHIQKHCSTAISSTVNLTKETTAQEIADLYKYAWKKGLKGLTIYRDGSKRNQPVTFRKEETSTEEIIKTITDLKIKRPKRLSGETHTVETGNGKMYVTINSAQRKPIEVFIEVGKAGQSMKVMSEALGRIVSIALQHRVPVAEVIKTLKGLDSSSPAWYRFEEDDSRPIQILSIPDGLAQLLERYYINTSKNDVEFLNGSSLSNCKKCGIRAYLETEGCGVCQNCGFSHCS